MLQRDHSYKLKFAASDIWNLHVVGGWGQLFEFLASKDVDSGQMDLGVTMFTGLGGRHFDDFAGSALDHNEAVLSQSRTLHRIGGRGAGVGTLERVLMLFKRGCQISLSRVDANRQRTQRRPGRGNSGERLT